MLALLGVLLLAACGNQAGPPNIGVMAGQVQAPPLLPQIARTRVGLLLPLAVRRLVVRYCDWGGSSRGAR